MTGPSHQHTGDSGHLRSGAADLSAQTSAHATPPQFNRLPIKEARLLLEKLLDPALEINGREYSAEVLNLARLNSNSPGILTWAIAPNVYQSQSLGVPYNETSAGKSAIPEGVKLNGNVSFINTGKDWLAGKNGALGERVRTVAREYLLRTPGFVDAPKPHLTSVIVDADGMLILTFDQARSAQNAAISKTMCNALRELLQHGISERVSGVTLESDVANINVVIKLFRDLGITKISDGIDFLAADSPFPQTMGVSVMAVTKDG
jgi:hypothetical protein